MYEYLFYDYIHNNDNNLIESRSDEDDTNYNFDDELEYEDETNYNFDEELDYEDETNFDDDYYDIGSDINNIVSDYTPLMKGQDQFLNGCIIELTMGDAQLYFDQTGGKFNQGHLSMTRNITDETNRKFLLEWAGYGGYYLWPMNGDKTIQIFFDPDDGTFNGALNGSGLPGKYELVQRVFKVSNLNVNDKKKLIVQLTISTSKFGNFPIYVDTNLNVRNGANPTNFVVKFITLSKPAWNLLIKNDPSVSAKCCFPDGNMSQYDNFIASCTDAGFTYSSKGVSDGCMKNMSDYCSSVAKQGFEDTNCIKWCTYTDPATNLHPNATACSDSLQKWCAKPENISKGVCACYNKKYMDAMDAACGAQCKGFSDKRAACYVPECLTSAMLIAAKKDIKCPDNFSCINNLDLAGGSSISAEKVIQQCGWNGGVVQPPQPQPQQGSTTGPKPLPQGTTTGPIPQGTTTGPQIQPPPPPPGTEDKQSFFVKYKWYLMGGGVAALIILMIIAGLIVSKNKSKMA